MAELLSIMFNAFLEVLYRFSFGLLWAALDVIKYIGIISSSILGGVLLFTLFLLVTRGPEGRTKFKKAVKEDCLFLRDNIMKNKIKTTKRRNSHDSTI